VPTALVTPTGPKPGHDNIPSARFDAQRHRITVGTTVAVRKDEEEDNGRRDEAQHEEADEDDGEYDGVGHPVCPPVALQPLLDLEPGFHVSQVAFDSFDYDFSSHVDGRIVETPRAKRAVFIPDIEADPTLAARDDR